MKVFSFLPLVALAFFFNIIFANIFSIANAALIAGPVESSDDYPKCGSKESYDESLGEMNVLSDKILKGKSLVGDEKNSFSNHYSQIQARVIQLEIELAKAQGRDTAKLEAALNSLCDDGGLD